VDEFFNLLCQRLEAQLKLTNNEKLLSSVFAGKLCYEIRSVDEVKTHTHIHTYIHTHKERKRKRDRQI